MREPGSGTRSTFEAAILDRGLDPHTLNVVLTLPSNEAVLAAVRAGVGSAMLSQLVVTPLLEARALFALPLALPRAPSMGCGRRSVTGARRPMRCSIRSRASTRSRTG
jgi:DNA-binding transcriptional LysR family regulator